MGIKTLVMRAIAMCKWSKPAALGKADRRLQVAIGTIFVSFDKCMGYNIITSECWRRRWRITACDRPRRLWLRALLQQIASRPDSQAACIYQQFDGLQQRYRRRRNLSVSDRQTVAVLAQFVARAGITAKIINRFVHHADRCGF